ncbi:MAG: hypothetical protein J6Q68_00125 [Clostridia bacterium]|nr:hypothetical protein [Clostridia bacterium]
MIKGYFKKATAYLLSLRVRFFLLLVIVFGIGVSIFFLTHFAAFNYINTVYTSEESKKAREREFIRDLQSYVVANDISSEQTGKISEWTKANKYVYLLIYKDDQLFYTSDDPPVEDKVPEEEQPKEPDDAPTEDEGDESDSTDGEEPSGDETAGDGETSEDNGEAESGDDKDKEDKEDKEPGGVTVDYPTREELFEYAKKNELYPLELTDGTMLASLTEFTEYLYYDVANITAMVVAILFIIVTIILYFQLVINRMIRLGSDVNKIAAGDMTHKIKTRGNDEISKLSKNVDEMRNSIIRNLKKEREALESNSELITSMSHDIRTPLTVLLGYIDVMQARSAGDEEMQNYLSAAESTALRLKKLSDDMFGYFLVFGNSEMEIAAESYDAITLIDQMLSEHVMLMKESGYNVQLYGFDYVGLSGVQVKTDAQKLVRIFDNVFSNIYKYADKNQPVSIYIEGDKDSARIKIENFILSDVGKVESNGIGLKTCKKLGEYIGAGFDAKTENDKFVVDIVLECHR